MGEDPEFPIKGYKDLTTFTQSVLKKVVQATQQGNALSSVLDEFEYWNSFPPFKRFCLEGGSRIINDIGELLRHNAVQCGWSPGGQKMSHAASSDIDERFERLIDANDIMIENIGSFIDEASGLKKNDKPILPPTMKQSSPIVSSWNKKINNASRDHKGETFKLLTAKNIQRPQLKWLDKIDNSNRPFIPYIKCKPNAIKPLEQDDDTENETEETSKDKSMENRSKLQRHAYEYELSVFEPQDWQLQEREPDIYASLEDTDLNMVYNQDGLDILLERLKDAQEIAIDLEHHSYRSFQGFVCLMQISTRDEDFIVDTLKLRDELYILNEVFTDPKILKVFHGADKDIEWLQRDFGLYIVNMFDTGQAARVLNEERYSLAYLLHKYCQVEAQKQFQLADWRIRPLPLEMLQYAREDTHYLLYIYDLLRNQLIQRSNEMKNLLRNVYAKSALLCGTVYQKPMLYSDSYMNVYAKYRGKLNPQQLECFRQLYSWRDKTARVEDESYGYTLPNHMMFQIAENLPKEAPGVIACCNPVPPLVKQNVMEIHRLVISSRHHIPGSRSRSKEETDIEATNDDPKKKVDGNNYQVNSRSSKTGFEIYSVTGPPVKTMKPFLTIFEEMIKEKIETTNGKKRALEILSILRSPFEMYLPNTGKEMVHPDKINKSWKDAVQSKMNADSQKVETQSNIVIDEEGPTKEDKPQKRKKGSEDVEELTLKEMLPKKKKKKEKEYNEEKSNEELPTKFEYEKNVKQSKDFVPFDYSKADLQKFTNAGKSNESNILDEFVKTKEPKIGRVIKTKIHSKEGSRAMTYK